MAAREQSLAISQALLKGKCFGPVGTVGNDLQMTQTFGDIWQMGSYKCLYGATRALLSKQSGQPLVVSFFLAVSDECRAHFTRCHLQRRSTALFSILLRLIPRTYRCTATTWVIWSCQSRRRRAEHYETRRVEITREVLDVSGYILQRRIINQENSTRRSTDAHLMSSPVQRSA